VQLQRANAIFPKAPFAKRLNTKPVLRARS